MPSYETTLSPIEQQWILARRFTRETDGLEVQIYPMGAERHLFSVLSGHSTETYDLKEDVVGKDVLVIPGHGNGCFLLAEAGAKSVTVYDKDPVTIAWIKAFKKYHHFREKSKSTRFPSIAELMTALTCWYPPLLRLPFGQLTHRLLWLFHPNGLRRVYIHYMVTLARLAILSGDSDDYELKKKLYCYPGTLEEVISQKKNHHTAFVPYLLGVQQGIEREGDILRFLEQLTGHVKGHVLVTPSLNTKEFHGMGKRYFVTTGLSSLKNLPGVETLMKNEDKRWFRAQGLAIFGSLTKPL